MTVLNRRDAYSAIPQLESKLSKLSDYITVEDGKIQIKIKDLYGNMASITEYAEGIEQRVEGIEDDYVTSTQLTQTKSDLTLEINEKAQVFTSQPTTPYYVGDLWTQGPNGEIYRCKTNRLSGNYNSSDWEKASDYTDDTTATTEANARKTIVRAFNGGVITAYQGNSIGVYTNASGSVDIVKLTWSGATPSIAATYTEYGKTAKFYSTDNNGTCNAEISGSGFYANTDYGPYAINVRRGSDPIFGIGTQSKTSALIEGFIGNISFEERGGTTGAYNVNLDRPIYFNNQTLHADGISTGSVYMSGNLRVGGSVYTDLQFGSANTGAKNHKGNWIARYSSSDSANIFGNTSEATYVRGSSVYRSGGGKDFDTGSDIRLKENIKPLDYASDIILGLDAFEFDWKERGSEKYDERKQLGVSAQKTRKLFKDKGLDVDQYAMFGQDGEYYTLSYGDFIPMLIRTVQDLNGRIKELEAKLEGKDADD